MANSASAKKYMHSSKKRQELNDNYRRKYREAIKKIATLLQEGKKKEALKHYPVAQKAIDKAVKRGVIKKNTGARKKAGLIKKLK
jgi:small subunit ribosomal protein S20